MLNKNKIKNYFIYISYSIRYLNLSKNEQSLKIDKMFETVHIKFKFKIL